MQSEKKTRRMILIFRWHDYHISFWSNDSLTYTYDVYTISFMSFHSDLGLVRPSDSKCMFFSRRFMRQFMFYSSVLSMIYAKYKKNEHAGRLRKRECEWRIIFYFIFFDQKIKMLRHQTMHISRIEETNKKNKMFRVFVFDVSLNEW